MGIFKSIMLLFLLANYLTLWSQNKIVHKIEGLVFIDQNKNGDYEDNEKVLKGIPVSDGDTIVLTNRKGEFIIQTEFSNAIFPILPSQYELSGSKVMNSNFHYLAGMDNPIKLTFGVNKVKRSDQFKVGIIGDVQVSDVHEMRYAMRSVMKELAERNDLDASIFLGDLVNDNSNLLPAFKQTLEVMPFDSWTVPGNHDRDKTGSMQFDTYKKFFSATNYAFNISNVHFIILNNIFPNGKYGYEGRYTKEQISFVRNDLQLIPDHKLVVICQHIPMQWVKNKKEILSLLDPYKKVLILSGHTHRISRYQIAPNIMEIVVGATSGNWWTGEKDWQGIPLALMQDGSPRGFFTIDFKHSDYNFRFKGIGLDTSKQMNVWVNGQDTLDSYLPNINKLKKNSVLVNVFAGSVDTRVRMQLDNEEWFELQKTDMVDPIVQHVVMMNKMKEYPTQFSRKAALRLSDSDHIWYGELPDGLVKGAHFLKIEATEPSGFYVVENTIFYID